MDASAALHVTQGRSRRANIEIVLARRRTPLRERRITIWVEAPKGERRRATIVGPDGQQDTFTVPARVDALEGILKKRVDAALERMKE